MIETSEKKEVTVDFRAVGYEVGGAKILNDINLQVFKGEILILLGESGCGKTTTLRLINRLIEPTRGEVIVEGKATTEWNAIKLRRKIGYVLQEAGLFPHFTIERNVALVPELEHWEKDKTHAASFRTARTRRTESGQIFGALPARTFRRSASARRCCQGIGSKSRFASARRTVRRVGRDYADKTAKRVRQTRARTGQNRRFRDARSARSLCVGNTHLPDGQRQHRARRNAAEFSQFRFAAGA